VGCIGVLQPDAANSAAQAIIIADLLDDRDATVCSVGATAFEVNRYGRHNRPLVRLSAVDFYGQGPAATKTLTADR
jgi:hypothetical protein